MKVASIVKPCQKYQDPLYCGSTILSLHMRPVSSAFHVLMHLLLSTVAILVAQKIVPGVSVDSWLTALTVAIVLGIINITIKPLLNILAFPINFLTLGLFSLVINAALLLLVAAIVPGFALASFWTAFVCAIVLAVINWFFSFIAP